MSVFEVGKTYRTRGNGEYEVIFTNDDFFWAKRADNPKATAYVWEQGTGKGICLRGEPWDLIPPEPPIPPVVVSDAVMDAWSKGPCLARQAISSVITAWLREHPQALAGYRRDCGQREGAE